jgi:hypothetical protein
MSELSCPWCDAALAAEPAEVVCQSCPDCLTTWRYEDEPAELALAA